MPAAEAVTRLGGEIVPFVGLDQVPGPQTLTEMIDAAGAVAAETTLKVMRFTPDSGFWPVLAARFGSAGLKMDPQLPLDPTPEEPRRSTSPPSSSRTRTAPCAKWAPAWSSWPPAGTATIRWTRSMPSSGASATATTLEVVEALIAEYEVEPAGRRRCAVLPGSSSS
ncbi:MAG: hypothetical protein IPH86_08445 [bacterium]|nr:hypothetical protein [bacterium]